MSVVETYLEETKGASEAWLISPTMSDLVHGLIGTALAADSESWLTIARSPEVTDVVAYGAFIGATTVARRQRNFQQFISMVEDFDLQRRFLAAREDPIKDGFRLHTAEAMMYSMRIGTGGSRDEALSIVDRLLPRFCDHHGAQNLLVEIILSTTDPTNPDMTLIDRASVANARSIELEPKRAKYVAHRGVIKAYQGRYRDAEMSIQRAIDLEDSGRWDYSAMIADHQSRLALIQSIRLSREINAEMQDARNEIADSRGQLLTLTGLLAAVVAIVIVNAGLAKSLGDLREAIALSFAGTGAIALVFGLLIGLVLTPRHRSQWILLCFVVFVGVLLMIVGLFAIS